MTRSLRLVTGEDDDRTGRVLFDNDVVFPWSSGTPLHHPDTEDLRTHVRTFGMCPHVDAAFVDVLADVELRGRGGAAYPVAAKWRRAAEAGGDGVVIANGAESEPASAKDAALLLTRPHLVLDGLTCAGAVTRARELIVVLHAGATATHAAVRTAIAEREGHDEIPIRIVTGPDRYLTGESSAIVRLVSGGAALPSFNRVPSAVSGVRGRPTVVHNVETLARVALAARHRHATQDSTLLTIVGQSRRVVVEVEPSTPFDAIDALRAAAPQAVLVGGYAGTWLPWWQLAALHANETSLRSVGAGLGAGVIVPLAYDTCGLAVTAELARYLAREGAGQCGPCVYGLPDVADIVTRLSTCQAGRRDVRQLRLYCDEITGRGACGHPDGVTRMVTTALTCFAGEVESHVRDHRCTYRERTDILRTPGGG